MREERRDAHDVMYQGAAGEDMGELTEVTSQEEVEGDWCGEIVVVPFCAFLVIYMVILSV